ncbi:hypothetical protein M501DRAFT_997353 [Patellaria atrata CBS 101060]|uniref:Uncharacterized protein n=1 Tax=Patellaria atrata CBS 101060 TaxID=1346257 RepID=A0A9P4S4P4_9PEZI|nr:hypothetical protein M501DRAFT_997353 [Patellaria atrata CBS 101060]
MLEKEQQPSRNLRMQIERETTTSVEPVLPISPPPPTPMVETATTELFPTTPLTPVNDFEERRVSTSAQHALWEPPPLPSPSISLPNRPQTRFALDHAPDSDQNSTSPPSPSISSCAKSEPVEREPTNRHRCSRKRGSVSSLHSSGPGRPSFFRNASRELVHRSRGSSRHSQTSLHSVRAESPRRELEYDELGQLRPKRSFRRWFFQGSHSSEAESSSTPNDSQFGSADITDELTPQTKRSVTPTFLDPMTPPLSHSREPPSTIFEKSRRTTHKPEQFTQKQRGTKTDVNRTNKVGPNFRPPEMTRVNTPPLVRNRKTGKIGGYFFDDRPQTPQGPPRDRYVEKAPAIELEDMTEYKATLSMPKPLPAKDWFRMRVDEGDGDDEDHIDEDVIQQFEWDTPDHLPNSPLCPLNPKHPSRGKGICVYHGRRKILELDSNAEIASGWEKLYGKEII